MMVISSWSDRDHTRSPLWIRDSRLNVVESDMQLVNFMVPVYRSWAELEENFSQVRLTYNPRSNFLLIKGFQKHQIRAWCTAVLVSSNI